MSTESYCYRYSYAIVICDICYRCASTFKQISIQSYLPHLVAWVVFGLIFLLSRGLSHGSSAGPGRVRPGRALITTNRNRPGRQKRRTHMARPGTPLPSNRHHRSSGDCLEGKGENYQVCSVQYCVKQLCTVQCTHI